MATTTQILRYVVDADTKGGVSGFQQVEKSAHSASGKLGGLKDMAAGVGLAFGTEQVLQYGQELYNTGLRLETLRAKSKVVFEGQIDDVKKWADENAAAMGLTTTELLGTTAAAADLLKPMGFTAAAATEMSKEMVGLSGALAAWSGGSRSAAEVATILQKSLLGERDGLKELGISITEADVQTRLAAKGKDKLKGAALEQAKAEETLALILAKSTDAQKAWNDGSMDGVKAANRQKASIGELKDSLATGLMPVFREVTSELDKNVVPALGELGKAIGFVSGKMDSEGSGAAKDFAQVLMGNVTPGIRQVTKQWQYIDDIWKGRRLDSLAIRTATWAEKLGLVAEGAGDAAGESDDLTDAFGRTEDQLKATEKNAKEYADELDKLRKRNEEVLKATEDLIQAHDIDLPKALDDVTSSLLGFYETTEESKKAQQGLSESSAEYQLEAIKQRDAGRDLEAAMLGYAKETLNAAESQATLTGKQLTAEEKAQILRSALNDLGLKFPTLKEEADKMAGKFDGMAIAAEDSGDRMATAMEKAAERIATAFNRIELRIGGVLSGLSMLAVNADQAELILSGGTQGTRSSAGGGAVADVAAYEKRNGPGWRQ